MTYLFLIKKIEVCLIYFFNDLLEIVQIAKACKLVIGMAQTSIMSVCINYIKVLYLPIIYKF